jgi:hypothetical protein
MEYKKKYFKYNKKYLNLQYGSSILPELKEAVINDSIEIAQSILNYDNFDREKPLLFICLGASPAYVYIALKTFIEKLRLSHSIIEIPLSGMSLIYSDEYTIPNADLLLLFSNYINPLISPYKDTHRIILIDHCHTCKSIFAFIKLLKKTGVYEAPIHYINLIDKETPSWMIKEPTNIDKYFQIRSSSLNKISGHEGIPRAVPQYLFWHDLGKIPDYSLISSEAQELRQNIKDKILSL